MTPLILMKLYLFKPAEYKPQILVTQYKSKGYNTKVHFSQIKLTPS